MCQKRPANVSKKIHKCVNLDRPIMRDQLNAPRVSQETRKCVKRDTQICQKIFTCVSNETHEYVQRDPKNQKETHRYEKRPRKREL